MRNNVEPGSRLAVIGANGFVGSHLVDALAALPDSQVVAFDRYSRPPMYEPAVNVTQFQGDYFGEGDVERAIDDADYVFHCFSPTTPSISDANPLRDVEMLHRTVEVFAECAKRSVKKVIYMSSGGAIYGESGTPAREDDAPRPVSPYGIGKLAMENYLMYFERKHGLSHVSFRLTNPYGPRQVFKNGQGVIPAFIDKVQRGEPLTLLGDGTSSRDYIYVEDAARMVANVFAQDCKNSVYNLGAGEQTSLNTIVKTVQSVLKTEVQITYKPAPETFLQRTDISMERYREEFGEMPMVSIMEGVSRMVEHQTQTKAA